MNTLPFEKIFCINLDHRQDRWNLSKKQFDQLGLNVERFSAVNAEKMNLKISYDGDIGAIGCSLSHLSLLTFAKMLKLKNYIVFEDDIQFEDNFIDIFIEIYENEVPKDWDIIYLGGWHVEKPIFVSKNVYRCVNTVTTHAIAIKETVYDILIDKIIDMSKPCDALLAEEQGRINAYVIHPPLCWQMNSYSNIMNRPSNASEKTRLINSFYGQY